MRVSRRGLLRVVGVGSLAGLAGCAVSVGTTDLTVRNCREQPHRVSVRITALADETTVHDATHRVPGETCVDVQEPPVAVNDVIDAAGRYRVRASGDTLEPVEEVREFDEAVVRNDDDSINVTVEDAGLNLN